MDGFAMPGSQTPRLAVCEDEEILRESLVEEIRYSNLFNGHQIVELAGLDPQNVVRLPFINNIDGSAILSDFSFPLARELFAQDERLQAVDREFELRGNLGGAYVLLQAMENNPFHVPVLFFTGDPAKVQNTFDYLRGSTTGRALRANNKLKTLQDYGIDILGKSNYPSVVVARLHALVVQRLTQTLQSG